jgi:hypothetical protein
MWYALSGIYGQERRSQECAKLEFCHPSGGGTIIAAPKRRQKNIFTSSLNDKMCFLC